MLDKTKLKLTQAKKILFSSVALPLMIMLAGVVLLSNPVAVRAANCSPGSEDCQVPSCSSDSTKTDCNPTDGGADDSEGDLVLPDSNNQTSPDNTATTSSPDAVSGTDNGSYSIDDITGSAANDKSSTADDSSAYDPTASPSIPETGGGPAGILMMASRTSAIIAGLVTMLMAGSLVVMGKVNKR